VDRRHLDLIASVPMQIMYGKEAPEGARPPRRRSDAAGHGDGDFYPCLAMILSLMPLYTFGGIMWRLSSSSLPL